MPEDGPREYNGAVGPPAQIAVAKGPAPGAEAASSRPIEIQTLEARLDGYSQRLTAVEGQRERILEFSFQSIFVVLTILALAAGIPFAILYGAKITSGDVAYVIAAALVASTKQ
ncbi:MAG: hypothetical protein WAN74_07510 [Thermoplasmata archaeon]